MFNKISIFSFLLFLIVSFSFLPSVFAEVNTTDVDVVKLLCPNGEKGQFARRYCDYTNQTDDDDVEVPPITIRCEKNDKKLNTVTATCACGLGLESERIVHCQEGTTFYGRTCGAFFHVNMRGGDVTCNSGESEGDCIIRCKKSATVTCDVLCASVDDQTETIEGLCCSSTSNPGGTIEKHPTTTTIDLIK